MELTLKEKTGIRGRVRIIQKKAGTEEILHVGEWNDNLIMLGTDTGRDLILDRLNGITTYSLDLGYADIGTGTNTPAVSDTTLQTVVARGLKATGNVSGSTLTLQYFYPDGALANNTYREFGTFVDGTATVSTGKIFNRVLFSTPYVKTTGVDTTVEVQITLA